MVALATRWNTTCVPSSVNTGRSSRAGPDVSCCSAEPSAFMIQMSWSIPATVRANTTRLPSGEVRGSQSATLFHVRRRMSVASSFIEYSSGGIGPVRLLWNTIRPLSPGKLAAAGATTVSATKATNVAILTCFTFPPLRSVDSD